MNDSHCVENLYAFWAKLPRKNVEYPPTRFHPLLCHMMDVAAVAEALWQEKILPQRARERLAHSLGLTGEEAAATWIAFLIGLHDLGKASPVFQCDPAAIKLKHFYNELPQLPLNGGGKASAYHQWITAVEMPRILPTLFGFQNELAEHLGIILGGHHGSFPRSGDLRPLSDASEPDGDPRVGRGKWMTVREQLTDALADALGIRRDVIPADDGSAHAITRDNAATLMLAGYVTVADWLGSDERYFRYAVRAERNGEFSLSNLSHLTVKDYYKKASERAREALDKTGWLGWHEPQTYLSFKELFAHVAAPDEFKPNALQDAVRDAAKKIEPPCLVIIEAPMGKGKTEAAMYLADYWGVRLKQRGCYFALPTQATSNQMYERVKKFLQARFRGTRITYQLAHGYAALNAEMQLERGEDTAPPVTPQGIKDEDRTANDAEVSAAEWFTYRKRAVLAPYGVGTVDQALLAVLQTRHYFVRHFGLAHKTIIVDEVHAYDAYTTELLKMLLRWLAAYDAPVVLLSATLPEKRRRELLRAYAEGKQDFREAQARVDSIPAVGYPRITYLSANEQAAEHAVSSEQDKVLHFRWIEGYRTDTVEEDFTLGEQLHLALKDGGCAAVICNTVDRAQVMYERLRPYFQDIADDGWPELDLFHARFRFLERDEIEKRVRTRFGKPQKKRRDGMENEDDETPPVRRPHRALLVATQVIEQSLDLDFDLMVSDFAPIDLLLQRSGRLHRHERQRPGKFATDEPTLWVCRPEEHHGLPCFSKGTEAVYKDNAHVLFRSWWELQKRTDDEGCILVNIPGSISELVEAAYTDDEPPPDESAEFQQEWRNTFAEQKAVIEELRSKAAVMEVSPPLHPSDFFEDNFKKLEEDNPNVQAIRQALTRSEPSVTVICLLPHEISEAKLEQLPDRETTLFLLARAVNISVKHVQNAVLMMPTESSWEKSAYLKHHRLLRFNENRECTLSSGQTLRLDEKLGLCILKKGKSAKCNHDSI